MIEPYLHPVHQDVRQRDACYADGHHQIDFGKKSPTSRPDIELVSNGTLMATSAAGQTPWSPLPRPELGRYRFSHERHIFHQYGGVMGHGYVICLRCGRSASETATGGTLPLELQDHYRLRGGKERNGQSLCPGNDQQWAIKRNQWLGLGVSTDVFELQLSDPVSGVPLNSDVAAYSLATALRRRWQKS